MGGALTASSTVPNGAKPSRNVSSVVCQANPLDFFVSSTLTHSEQTGYCIPDEQFRHVAEMEKAEWQRTDPEVQARAQQFWNRVKDFEAQAEKAEKSGRTEDAEKARAQAAQWTEWAKAAEDSLNGR